MSITRRGLFGGVLAALGLRLMPKAPAGPTFRGVPVVYTDLDCATSYREARNVRACDPHGPIQWRYYGPRMTWTDQEVELEAP